MHSILSLASLEEAELGLELGLDKRSGFESDMYGLVLVRKHSSSYSDIKNWCSLGEFKRFGCNFRLRCSCEDRESEEGDNGVK